MPAAAPSPRRRESQGLSLGERNLNTGLNDVQSMVPRSPAKAQQGMPAIKISSMPSFQIDVMASVLSPGKQARRSLKPRKSILKSISAGSLAIENIALVDEFQQVDSEQDTQSFRTDIAKLSQGDHGHTVAFPKFRPQDEKPGLSRRVSFAPNAHVRMFDKPGPRKSMITLPPPPPIPAGPRPSISSHARKASIQNLSSVGQESSAGQAFQPQRFIPQGEAQGEDEMSIEVEEEEQDLTASEQEDEAEDNYLAPPKVAAPRFSIPAAKQNESSVQADDDDEMDMDMTINHGGFIARQSLAPQNNGDGDVTLDSEANSSAQMNEEQTMDFTIAIGGFLPASPPAGATATAMRTSIGYTLPGHQGYTGPSILPGQGDYDEADMQITTAIGGIIAADETMSTVSGDDTLPGNRDREHTVNFSFNNIHAALAEEQDGMEMTIATGGIIAVSRVPHSPAPHSISSITRPAGGTPSFARPTVSSASKEKRNIFGPSPSPIKSATPKKSGMEVAAEVAMRLSFGSTTSSGGKRSRAQTLDDEGESAEDRRATTENVFSASMTSNVFASPASRSIRARTSLAVPTSTTPSRSPASRRAVLGVPPMPETGERDENWRPPTISLAAFLEMAGVTFIDALPGMNRRRRSSARGVLARSLSGERDFGLELYTDAQLHSIFLHMYSWAASKMKADILNGQSDLNAIESYCSTQNPPVIEDYLSASDEEKQLFESTFKAFKTNTQLKAKGRWYDWKMELMEKTKPDVEEILTSMQADDEKLTSMVEELDVVIPQLRERFALLSKELERERAIVAVIEECDQAELKDYKDAAAEQEGEIKKLRSSLQDEQAKLAESNAKLADLRAKKLGHSSAIALAKSKCDQYTKSDIFRLKEEYKSLQHIHLWDITTLTADQLVLTFDKEFNLSFACTYFTPDLSSAAVERIPKTVEEGKSPKKFDPTEGLFQIFRGAVQGLTKRRDKEYRSLPAFVQRTGQLYSAVQRLRSEITLINSQILTSISSATQGALVVTVHILLKQLKSKVKVNFHFTPGTLMSWPAGLADVVVDVEVVYGSANVEKLTQAARETVATHQAEGYLGGLIQVCFDVQNQEYEHEM